MIKEYVSPEFLDALRSVRWKTALRTYGNNHSTLIGLLVEWWVNRSRRNFAIESGPGIGGGQKGKGRGNCDAIFGENDRENNRAVGVLEVEGPVEENWKWCVEKIRRFFGAERDVFKSLRFAILLIYPDQPRGRGDKRGVESIDRKRIISLVKPISKQYPNKGIVVIAIDKLFDRGHGGIRALNDYYKCTPKTIWGALLAGGKVVKERDFVSQLST